MRRRARPLLLIAVNLLLLLLVVGALEFGASFLVDRPDANFATSFRLNHTWKPSSRKVHREWARENPRFPKPYVHSYNAQGWLESYDVAREKPPNTFRIFYVGDSFVESTTPMEESLPSRVERALDERGQAAGLDFEVVNTGTSSYSPLIAYVLIRSVLLDYEPDLIVVNVDMSDEYDDWKYAQTGIWDEDGNPWAMPPRETLGAPFLDGTRGAVRATPLARLQFLLYRYSHLYNLLLEWRSAPEEDDVAVAGPAASSEEPEAAAAAEPPLYARWAWCQEEWDAEVERNAGRTLDALARIAKLAQEAGVRLVFSTSPHYEQYNGAPDGSGAPAWSDRPHREVARVARENDVPFIDAFTPLAEWLRGAPQDRWYYKGNMHFNPDGYSLWAQVHSDFLSDPRNALLPAAFYAGSRRDGS